MDRPSENSYSPMPHRLDSTLSSGKADSDPEKIISIQHTSITTKHSPTSAPLMPKMENATAKALLGRSSWHLLHTMLSRYPEAPTDLEKDKLTSFVQLFAELYPCGECSHDFLQLLNKYPVQASSRKAAALWGCSMHNKVNERLEKPMYDCANVLEDYDCGCGEQPAK